jgi:hypothetical protein
MCEGAECFGAGTLSGALSNVAFGGKALRALTSGDNNVATGVSALESNTSGRSNVATGFEALLTNTTGDANVATGNGALFSNKTGSYNVATGASALFSNTTHLLRTTHHPAARAVATRARTLRPAGAPRRAPGAPSLKRDSCRGASRASDFAAEAGT